MLKTYTTKTVINILSRLSVDYKADVDLSNFTYFKTGGIAKLVIFPSSTSDLKNVLREFNENSIRFKIVGETTNLMFLDEKLNMCLYLWM